MTELLLMKFEDGLHPADDEARQAIRQVPENSIVKVKVSVPRNVRQHRLFFALINIVFEHQKEPHQFATREALREAITIAAGHSHEVKNLINGQVFIVPNSIAFGAMDNVQFREFFDAAVRVITERILPHVTKADLEEQIRNMLQ